MAYVDSLPTKMLVKDRKLGSRKIQSILSRPRTKIVHGTEKTVWSDEDRLNAVHKFILTGDMRVVSDTTGISINTLRDWRKYSQWWKDLENILRDEANIARASNISDLTERVIDSIGDRVQHGDFVYNPRTGEIARVPVSATTLNKIASTMIEKQQVLTKQPTSYNNQSTDSKQQLENKLTQLADAFKSFAGKNALKQPEIIEGELVASP